MQARWASQLVKYNFPNRHSKIYNRKGLKTKISINIFFLLSSISNLKTFSNKLISTKVFEINLNKFSNQI